MGTQLGHQAAVTGGLAGEAAAPPVPHEKLVPLKPKVFWYEFL